MVLLVHHAQFSLWCRCLGCSRCCVPDAMLGSTLLQPENCPAMLVHMHRGEPARASSCGSLPPCCCGMLTGAFVCMWKGLPQSDCVFQDNLHCK